LRKRKRCQSMILQTIATILMFIKQLFSISSWLNMEFESNSKRFWKLLQSDYILNLDRSQDQGPLTISIKILLMMKMSLLNLDSGVECPHDLQNLLNTLILVMKVQRQTTNWRLQKKSRQNASKFCLNFDNRSWNSTVLFLLT